GLEPVERARRLAREVDRVHSPGGDRDKALPAVSRLQAEFGGFEVLLGDVERACGGGVCRHRSLLFKMMADEAGLETALVRGNMLFPGGYGGHAWNELHLGDGRVKIIDVMNPEDEFVFPDVSEKWVQKSYVTVSNEPIYGVE
ncbi:MAG: hypothetical protein P8J87_16250, partial [Verrucomicrobiales bacterium]|nr:hypothetical protein [Verrucomicrobiales bacterium]